MIMITELYLSKNINILVKIFVFQLTRTAFKYKLINFRDQMIFFSIIASYLLLLAIGQRIKFNFLINIVDPSMKITYF